MFKVKTSVVLLIAFGLFVGMFSLQSLRVSKADALDTYHADFKLLRAPADEDGATFTAIYDLTYQGNFGNKGTDSLANGGPFTVKSQKNRNGSSLNNSAGGGWLYAFTGKNYNGPDCTFKFAAVGWARRNGPLQVLCTGTGTLGTQAVIEYPLNPITGVDAVGELVDVSDANYTHSTTTFVDSTDTGSFTGAVAGMMAYVTGTNLTDGYYQVTGVTDANTLVISGMTSTNDNTDSTIEMNPAFWADTLVIDDVNDWPAAEAKLWPGTDVYNVGNNQVCQLAIDWTGFEYGQILIWSADAATGQEAGDVGAFGRIYK